jgi:two-component system, OmpR family, sensor kinase
VSTADPPVRTTSLQLRVTASVLGLILVVLVLLGLTVNWLLGARLQADVTQRLLDRAAVGQLLAKDDLAVQDVLNRLTGGETSWP